MILSKRAETRDSIFTTDSKYLNLNAEDLGAVTLDFVCLPCHQNETLEWVSPYTDSIHQKDLVSSIESETPFPKAFALKQNHPNPIPL